MASPGADGTAKVVELPLEVLHEIADALSDPSNGADATAVRAFKNCSLANRSFAAAFQPHVFHNTVVTIGDDPELERRAQEKLEILTSNPRLQQHVKHLTVAPICRGDVAEIFASLLDRRLFPTLTTVEVVGVLALAQSYWSHWETEWDSIPESLRTSIKLLCDASTLKALAFLRIEGIPPSIVLSNKTITSLSLMHSSLGVNLFPQFDAQSPLGPPLSLDVSGMEFTAFQVSHLTNLEWGLCSRVRSLTGTTTWNPYLEPTFSTLVFELAEISPLQSLNMTVSISEHGPGIFYRKGSTTPTWIEPFTRLCGLRKLVLSSDWSSDPTQFVLALPDIIRTLDTSRLAHLSIRVLHLAHCSLGDIYNSRSFLALNAAIAEKWNNHQLEMLEELKITMHIRNEIVVQRRGARRVARGAGFLSSLPEEKVRIVLVAQEGNVVYDSGLSMS